MCRVTSVEKSGKLRMPIAYRDLPEPGLGRENRRRPLGRGTEGPPKVSDVVVARPAGPEFYRDATTPPMWFVMMAAASRARSTSSGTRLGVILLPEARTSSVATTDAR